MNGAPRPVTNHTAGTWKDAFSLSHRQVFANSLVESLKKIPIGGPPERIVKYAQQTENNAFETAQSREEYFAIMRERMEYVRNTVDRRRNAALNNGQVQVSQGQAQAPQHPPQPPQPPQQPIPPQQQTQFVTQQRPPEDMFNTVPMNQQPHQSNPLSQFQQQPSQAQPPQATGPVSVPNVSGNQPQYNAAYQNALRQLMSQQQQQQHQQQQNQQQGRNIPLNMQGQQGQSGILSQATPALQQNHQNPRNAAILSMIQQQQARLQAQQGNVPTQQQQHANQQLAQQTRQRLVQNGGRNNPAGLQAMLQLLQQQQQRQQQAPQQQQQDQVTQQMQQSPQQPQDSQTSTSMQQVRSATGQITNDVNTPNNYAPIQQAQMQMFRKLVQAQKQQQHQSAVAGQMQQPRRIGQMMNSTAQQQPIMTQRDQQLSGTHPQQQELQQEQDAQQSQQHPPQQESQQPQIMQPNGPPQRAAIAQNAGRPATNVLQTEQGQPPSHPQLTQQQLDATVKNYVLKSKIPQALLKMMPFLPPEVNTWTEIYNLMKSNSIPGDALPIIRNVHAQNEQLVRNLFTKQGHQAQRLANDSQASLQGGHLPMHMPGVIQVSDDAKSSPVMMNQQPTNQRPGAPGPKIDGSPSSSRMTVQQHQMSQGSQPQQFPMNQQASMTIPHQYSGQNTTHVMANINMTQQQQAQMTYNNILTQSPQRKQTTPIIQPSQMPPHHQPQHQWMMDTQQTTQQASAQQQVQQPLQGNIPLQNGAGQVELEGASNSQKPPYGPEQQEQDRARIRELYEEVSRSRTKQLPVELLPEDQTKTQEMILQLQEACRQMDRLIHWAHANFHNDSVTKRLIAMQFAYRDQFEVLNRGIFYFTPESIAKFRVELSKFFNYVRRHHQLKQSNGGASLPMNMGMPVQQSASGSHVLMPHQQTVAQVPPQDRIQQGQQVQMPPGRQPQQPINSTMSHQGGQQMTFEPNLTSAAQRQKGNATSTPTTTSAVPPQQRSTQQQMMSQPRQAIAPGSFPAQQFVPQSMPGSAMPVSAPIPASTPRQPSRRNQKAPAAGAAQAQAVVAAGNGVTQTTAKQFSNLPGQAPIIIPQPQMGKSETPSIAVGPSPVISSAASPQGVHTPMAHFDPAQLKVPQSRKRSLAGTTSGKSNESSPVIDSEPPLKKEKTEPKAAAKGKQTAAQVKAAAAAQALALAAENANAKQRVAAEEIAAKRRELAVKDPLGYALQAVADICGVDPQTGKDVEGPDSSRTGILSQVKVMYSELLHAIC
ncbi:hypothetical protein V1517DRAFT_98224 [Lipomyces orientalis]|uniref:Uncharacterized protein n=1 Tax=Lipomyces orientalis TaxID=1233043 RepID=A0ACC3TRN5_9ASCO